MTKKNLFKTTKGIVFTLFLCLCLTVQGQNMLGYEVGPPIPMLSSDPNVSRQEQQRYQQQLRQQQQERTRRQQQQEQIIHLTGYYYQQSHSYNPNGNLVHRVSLKVKISESYMGEIYQVVAYKDIEASSSWQTCYGGNASYDRNEEAYYTNVGGKRVYFNR